MFILIFGTIEFTDEFSPESVIALQISFLPQIHQSVIYLRELLIIKESSTFIRALSQTSIQLTNILENARLLLL
ncbi:unnamed protein product [Rotaria sordida]|uniref:Uncharacterized protein n=1 Tax=Rotaria sordida TaxID=392033 RepID=A0A819SJB1_9BILA|nr:unnamed protein product [Rotaria sordida]